MYWKEDKFSKEIVLLVELDGNKIGDAGDGCIGRHGCGGLGFESGGWKQRVKVV